MWWNAIWPYINSSRNFELAHRNDNVFFNIKSLPWTWKYWRTKQAMWSNLWNNFRQMISKHENLQNQVIIITRLNINRDKFTTKFHYFFCFTFFDIYFHLFEHFLTLIKNERTHLPKIIYIYNANLKWRCSFLQS